MLNQNEIMNFANIIKNNFPDDAQDLSEALDLVGLVLDSVYDNISFKVQELFQAQTPQVAQALIPISTKVLEIKKEIMECSSFFINEEELEDEINVEMADEETERKKIPNYDEYIVDETIPHSLTENFKFTKACAFSLHGQKYDVKDMRDVLVKTCSLLYAKDFNKFYNFLNDNTLKGRKVSYFSQRLHVEKNPLTNNDIIKNREIDNSGIFVWVHLSCNDISKLIIRILKKFNININSFKIYLRADYTDLHRKKDVAQIESTSSEYASEKIGKYVKSQLDSLSQKGHIFSETELSEMQSIEWTKRNFGSSVPFFKKFDKFLPISEQIKIKQNNRYWKDCFIFSGNKYFVSSQWYEYQREKFDSWLNAIGKD